MIMYGVLENGFLIPVVPFPIAIKLHLIQLTGGGLSDIKVGYSISSYEFFSKYSSEVA